MCLHSNDFPHSLSTHEVAYLYALIRLAPRVTSSAGDQMVFFVWKNLISCTLHVSVQLVVSDQGQLGLGDDNHRGDEVWCFDALPLTFCVLTFCAFIPFDCLCVAPCSPTRWGIGCPQLIWEKTLYHLSSGVAHITLVYVVYRDIAPNDTYPQTICHHAIMVRSYQRLVASNVLVKGHSVDMGTLKKEGALLVLYFLFCQFKFC